MLIKTLVFLLLISMGDFRKTSHRYLLTYGASGQSITHALCSGTLEMDECYTLTQRDLKYTLVHLLRLTVRSTMTSLMCRLDEMYQIKSASVFGYPAVSLGPEIDEHPGMLLIVEHLNKSSPLLDCWLVKGTVKDNKQGLLYAHLTGFDVDTMNKTQLLNYVKVLGRKLAEANAKASEVDTMSIELEQLLHENRRLNRKLETQRCVFIKAGRESELLPHDA